MPHYIENSNSLEEKIHVAAEIPHIQSFVHYLAMGANPHIAPFNDGKDLFRKLEDLNHNAPDIQSCQSTAQMSRLLLNHEMKRPYSYFTPDRKLADIPQNRKAHGVSPSPRSIMAGIQKRDHSYTNYYANEKELTSLEI